MSTGPKQLGVRRLRSLLEAVNANTEHPRQPMVIKNGVLRFKANAIVEHLLNTHPRADMNTIALGDFTVEDRRQFAQLIGYSRDGYGDLSYSEDQMLVLRVDDDG